ncbi:PhzF family phenazine biosynthesis protein [Microbacterium proteolyticum]|uniref:PhzF family phenazine biosynthesis protein n=1 Tax=Microbacterium TaxID=33882 RepID=UPI002782C695|nr:PhzF family phenazine biosynthesis protein [Microbacterium proteolyticum]MDQ1084685.1 putative PhzF superfamily epimerase YddE/YHI9 [Microbacterium sp. SORGH_AS_0344]MDQ1170038.1 putative PhzF superfamily epimerase YddE/YHI9 [Microbacterium proteolyticum]
MRSVHVSVRRVFANKDGQFGNPVGLVADSPDYDDDLRQRISLATGFSETIFITSFTVPSVRIFTPQTEIDFAGHALVGAVNYISEIGDQEVTSVETRAGRVEAWNDNRGTWVRSALISTPPWMFERLPSAEAVEDLTGPLDPSQGYTVLWSWSDEPSGMVRARTFAADWGIPEDEANGSGVMKLAATLGREISVLHGVGSVVRGRPSGPGYAEVGGFVSSERDVEVSV